ncbi:unnamed protein product [Linum trigynum]|uniref:RNase H type-1 domain-containing protein n=1 Tax=Linum trigynum TaxID=586398 RepID=A0AAV2GH79_9ROSI
MERSRKDHIRPRGLVVRDGQGSIVFVNGFLYAGVDDPYSVELLALRDAIRWCSLKGLTEVVFRGDAKVFLDKIREREVRDVKGGSILEEIQLLRQQYARFEV